MVSPPGGSAGVRFGVFELDLATGELRRRGFKVRLQEQPFRVLALLVSRPGELVTRDELRSALWPDSVFVDFDHGLNKAVAKIRRALGDLADNPHYIETLERRGYRFTAPVEPIAPAASAAGAMPAAAVHRLVWGDRSILLTAGSHLIGRDPGSTVWIDSSVVSRRHATIVVAGKDVTIVDHASTNGTFVNERPVDKATLADGDEIRVGEARLTFRSTPSCATTQPEPRPATGPHPHPPR